MTSTGTPADANILAGDFGEAWLEVVAAACGILHGRPTTVDLEKADVELVLREYVGGTYNPAVKVQVKTTHDLRPVGTESFAYDLDVGTYNILRRTDHSFRRVLAVIKLSDDDERVRLDDLGTLLLGRGAWTSLEGKPETPNSTTQVVHLPAANTLDDAGLRRMLATYGIRSSTVVPDIDPWKENAE